MKRSSKNVKRILYFRIVPCLNLQNFKCLKLEKKKRKENSDWYCTSIFAKMRKIMVVNTIVSKMETLVKLKKNFTDCKCLVILCYHPRHSAAS